jgi:hypothetical protein
VQPPAAQPPAAQPPAAQPKAAKPKAQPKPAASTDTYAQIWTPRSATGTIHLHGGLFAPVKASGTSTTLGARLGINLGTHMQLGVLSDWIYETRSLLQPVNNGLPGPQPQIVLARVDAHLIPAMLFLEVKLTDKFPVVPYAGVAAGYEWLLLKAKDYRDGTSASATFHNLAWQSYGGVGLRLSKGLRLDGEVFFNGGSPARDVDVSGTTFSEKVDLSGVGARVGVGVVY